MKLVVGDEAQALRKELEVLKLQVKALREVQEQTAEIHWKVISNVVEERDKWEARYKAQVALRPFKKG